MRRAHFKKKVNVPRPHIFLDVKTNSVVMLNEPEKEGFVTAKTAFEVTCFSRTENEVDNLVETLKRLLEQSGLGKDAVHDGDFDENCDKHFIRSISETRRSALIKEVGANINKVFTQLYAKKALRRLTTFPVKFFKENMFMFFAEDAVMRLDPRTLVSRGIMEEKFSLECKICETPSDGAPIFDLKKDASSALQKKVLLCPSCGNRLTSESATIQSYFRFTDLGLQCAKGLWLEAYVKSIIEELGVKGDMMKYCAVHGKDELDLVFTYYGNLYVCECRDRVVGRNDVYVLAMKASRINEEEETAGGAIVNKVLMVSTEPISKDIISTARARKEDTEPEYIFVSGDPEAVKKQIVKVIRKAKQGYKRKKIKQLSRFLLDCLPPRNEEIYKRFLETEEIM